MKPWIGVVTTPSSDPGGVRIRRDVPGSVPIEAKPVSAASGPLAAGDKVLVLQHGPALFVIDKVN